MFLIHSKSKCHLDQKKYKYHILMTINNKLIKSSIYSNKSDGIFIARNTNSFNTFSYKSLH